MNQKETEALARGQAEENLEFIRNIITEGQAIVIQSGPSLILWGALICAATLVSYLLPLAHLTGAIFYVWILVYVGGVVATFVLLTRGGKQRLRGSLVGRVYGFAWVGATVFVTAFGVGGIASGKVGLEIFMSAIAGVVGIAYFISGAVTRYRWLYALSFGWWAGCAASPFISARWAPAVLGSLVLALELVPGLLVRFARKVDSRAV